MCADVPATVAGIAETTISGRMEMLQAKDGLTVCVDYAHNYISLKRALQYLRQTHPHGQVVVVVGGVGGKAESRRADIGRAVSEEADVAYITEDDSANVDPRENHAGDCCPHYPERDGSTRLLTGNRR